MLFEKQIKVKVKECRWLLTHDYPSFDWILFDRYYSDFFVFNTVEKSLYLVSYDDFVLI